MKIEYLDAPKQGINLETRVLKSIQQSSLFPQYIDSGSAENFRYLIMELLGPSVSLLRRTMPEKKLSKYTYLNLSIYMIKCIKKLHGFGFVHRDIKPGNFLIRPDKHSPLCLIDFGLSRSYVDPETGFHVQPRAKPGYVGTVRYASLHAHDEEELSRRDDMISWFYSIIEIAIGKLPWPGGSDKDETVRLKRMLTPQELCADLPKEFLTIYKHIISLEHPDAPDYNLYISLINQAIAHEKFKKQIYDWEKLDEDEIMEISSIPFNITTNQNNYSEVFADEISGNGSPRGHCCTIF